MLTCFESLIKELETAKLLIRHEQLPFFRKVVKVPRRKETKKENKIAE